MCFKSGFIGLDGLRWWHYIDRQSFQHVPDWCLAYCVTILETLDFGIKFSFWNENYNFVFHILAARIVSLIGLGPSCLTRNSDLASTQALTLGLVFAAVLYCFFWKWMVAWREKKMKYPRVLCLHSFLFRVVLLSKKNLSRVQYIGAADADITQSSFVDSTACPRPKYGCVTRRLPDILPSIGWARWNREGKYLILPRGSLSCLIYWFER